MTTIAKQPSLQTVLAASGADLTDALTALAAQVPALATPVIDPAPAQTVVLSAEAKRALRSVATQVEAFEFPDRARVLTEDERTDAIAAYVSLKMASSALKSAEEAFKSAFHNHLDMSLLDTDGVEQDKNGHYLAAGEVTAPHLSQKIVRQVRGGKPDTLTYEDLQKLEEDGALTHAEVLNMTTAVYIPAVRTRAVDPDKVMGLLKRDTARVSSALARVLRLTGKSTAITVAKV